MAWQNIGTISVSDTWQFSDPIPDEVTVIRCAGGSTRAFAWIGFFKSTSSQEVLQIKAFKGVGTWRLYNVPPSPFPLRLGAILPRPSPRYPNPQSFTLSVAIWNPT